MIIIISPSKTQALAPNAIKKHSIPPYLEKSQSLIEQLKKLSIEELGQVMAMSAKLSQTNATRYLDFDFPPQLKKSCQALFTFQGDVYSQININQYSEEDIRYAQDHLRILSGLYGILQPLDLIQPHRLEMGAKFKPEASKSLYTFWRNEVTSSLHTSLQELKVPMLLDLASQEYTKVIDKKKLEAPVIDVFFKQNKDGKLRTVAIYAKRARGAMVDYVISNRSKKLTDLYDFSFDGYCFDKKRSTDTALYFVQ